MDVKNLYSEENNESKKKRIEIDEKLVHDILKAKYHDGLSSMEIKDKLGVSPSTLCRIDKLFGDEFKKKFGVKKNTEKKNKKKKLSELQMTEFWKNLPATN